LRMLEKLLFDHDTDKPRKPTELIFISNYLKLALEQNGLAGPHRIVKPDAWKVAEGEGADLSGNIMLGLMLLILVFVFPVERLRFFRNAGHKLFALISGIGGSIALPVFLFTTYQFMDETLMFLVFSPLDFLLMRNSYKFKKPAILLYFGLFRLGMLLLALILDLTLYRQQMALPLAFSLCFFIMFTINQWKAYRGLAETA